MDPVDPPAVLDYDGTKITISSTPDGCVVISCDDKEAVSPNDLVGMQDAIEGYSFAAAHMTSPAANAGTGTGNRVTTSCVFIDGTGAEVDRIVAGSGGSGSSSAAAAAPDSSGLEQAQDPWDPWEAEAILDFGDFMLVPAGVEGFGSDSDDPPAKMMKPKSGGAAAKKKIEPSEPGPKSSGEPAQAPAPPTNGRFKSLAAWNRIAAELDESDGDGL
jgi:hypothetical protein